MGNARWPRWALIAATLVATVAVAWGLCSGFSIPTAEDAQEASDVWRAVEHSGVVPSHAAVSWRPTRTHRQLLVYGVEDPEEQEAIVRAAGEARIRFSTLPVKVVFHRATVVHERGGGARFPGGTKVIRTETIP